MIDDREAWRDLIVATFDHIYACDTAAAYLEAATKINTGNYKVVCLNWTFGSVDKGRKLLTLLKEKYSHVPVVLISGALSEGGLLARYPNIKEICIKGNEPELSSESTFIKDLLDIIPPLIRQSTAKNGAHPITLENSRVFSWLHLSDLHIGSKTRSQDWNLLKKALLRDVMEHKNVPSLQQGRLAGVDFQPDLLLITGDVAYCGKREEYEQAGEFLEELWKITGLDKHRTFTVPGNHDVCRSVVEKDPLHDLVYQSLADHTLDESSWDDILHRWQNYPALYDLLYKKFENYLFFASRWTAAPETALYYSQPIQIRDIHAMIYGLNSALISWKDREDIERSLWMGPSQISAEAPMNTFNIALVHHPREAIHEHDAVWSLMERKCQLLLHGHLHQLKTSPVYEPEHEHICLSAGSIYERGLWHSQRYYYGCIDLNHQTMDLYLRMTKPGRDVIYIRDNQTYPESGPDGHIRFALTKPLV